MGKFFTIKSLGLGIFGALCICAAAYPNDFLVRSNFMVGNYLPISVYGFLLVFALLIRPVLGRLSPRLDFSNRELVVAATLMLAACGIPTSGLMRYFPALTTGPYTYSVTNQQWQDANVLRYMPDKLTPEGWYREGRDPDLDRKLSPEERRERERRASVACEGFSRGMVSGRRIIHFWSTGADGKRIPLRSWLPMLRYWGPFLVLFCLFVVMMIVVVQPQWSRNELLPYPIAELTVAMIHVDEGRRWPAMFYRPNFWVAFGAVAFIHFIRFIHAWFPDTMIDIPLEWRLLPIRNHFPDFAGHALQSWGLFSGRFYFAAFAFAYFIPTEVSFSLGITPFALAFMTYFLWSIGYKFNYENLANSGAGAYLGMTFMILVLGRHYYWNVLRSAFGLRTRTAVPRQVRVACRVFLLAYAGLIVMAVVFGLSIYMALLVITGIGVMFLVTARIIAETGSFFIQTVWKPFDVIFGLLGGRAMGPYTMSVLGVISNLFCWDPRETLSCFVINGLKICERENVPRLKMAGIVSAVLVPCLAVAFLATLWVNYNGRGSDRYILRGRNLFRTIATVVMRERAEPARFAEMCRFDRGEGMFSLKALGFRLRNISGRPSCLPWLAFGFGAVVFCYVMKLRYNWWIVHPIIFLVWGNGGGVTFSASFLAGCLVKNLTIRYGGGRVYQNLKSMFMGCIVGEIGMAAAIMVFNVWYYFHYEVNPVRYYIFPA